MKNGFYVWEHTIGKEKILIGKAHTMPELERLFDSNPDRPKPNRDKMKIALESDVPVFEYCQECFMVSFVKKSEVIIQINN